jgi:hypothetical protein
MVVAMQVEINARLAIRGSQFLDFFFIFNFQKKIVLFGYNF